MSPRNTDLHVHEQLMLIVLRDDTGTPESRAGMYSFALGGAILSELIMAGCLAIEDGKKPFVKVVKVKPMHEPVLDECLRRVASAKRRRQASGWVSGFAHVKRLRHRIAEGLCRRGILKDSEDRVLLLFKRKAYPTIDPGPETRLRQRMDDAVLTDSEAVDPDTAIVVALAHGTGLLRVYYDRKTLKNRKGRIEQITNGDLIAGATREAVQAAQAAVIIAAAAATSVTTMAASAGN